MFPYSFWGHMSHHKFHLNRLQEPWCNNQGEMEPSIISFSIKYFNLEAEDWSTGIHGNSFCSWILDNLFIRVPHLLYAGGRGSIIKAEETASILNSKFPWMSLDFYQSTYVDFFWAQLLTLRSKIMVKRGKWDYLHLFSSATSGFKLSVSRTCNEDLWDNQK